MAELSRGQILKDPEIYGSLTAGAKIRLRDGDESAYIDVKVPDTVTTSYVFTLPADDGLADQVLKTDGSGTTSWTTVNASAGGSNTQIQYNNGGVFAGATGLTTDGSNLQIGATGELRLADTDSSNYLAFKSPGTVSANRIYTLPDTIGTVGQVLKIASGATSTAATLEWADDALGVTNNPGGSDTHVQFNDGGVFGGDAGLTYNKTTDVLSVTGAVNVATGGSYQINGTSVLNSTTLGSGVTSSSLTTVGTLTALQVDNININGNVVSSTDTNGNIDLDPNGTGFVRILGDAPLRLMDAANTNYVGINVPASVTSPYTLTLPATNGAENTTLQFDNSQNGSFVSNTRTLNFIIDGGGSTLTTGIKGVAILDANYTLTAWTIYGNSTGVANVDVGRAAEGTYPKTSGATFSTITSPNLGAGEVADRTTGLSITITAGDILQFNLTSNTGAHSRITVTLRLVPR